MGIEDKRWSSVAFERAFGLDVLALSSRVCVASDGFGSLTVRVCDVVGDDSRRVTRNQPWGALIDHHAKSIVVRPLNRDMV